MASKKADELKIDPVMEKPWQRAKRFEMYELYNKSAYPPMRIEPMPYERNRLANGGMTPEQRALRKQWVKDQILHHKPRDIPEVQPYNIFRRIYRWPADNLLHKPLEKLFGLETANLMRFGIPKLVMAAIGGYIIYYQMKYHPSDWTRVGGVYVYSSKPQLFGQDAQNIPPKDPKEFADLGFKSRKALLLRD